MKPQEPASTGSTKAAITLGSFLVIEGWWVGVNMAPNPREFLSYLGFAAGRIGTAWGWVLALLVTAAYVAISLRLPSVRENLIRPSFLKLLAILMAIAAGMLEEAFFRRMLMNSLMTHGWGVMVQIVLSAAAFGVAHGIWGLFGRSITAAIGATVATGLLGGALAVVYVISNRSLAACVAAHILIDVFIEPGLVLAAIRGEMGAARLA